MAMSNVTTAHEKPLVRADLMWCVTKFVQTLLKRFWGKKTGLKSVTGIGQILSQTRTPPAQKVTLEKVS